MKYNNQTLISEDALSSKNGVISNCPYSLILNVISENKGRVCVVYSVTKGAFKNREL